VVPFEPGRDVLKGAPPSLDTGNELVPASPPQFATDPIGATDSSLFRHWINLCRAQTRPKLDKLRPVILATIGDRAITDDYVPNVTGPWGTTSA
jgi:hypothetical protein